MSSRFPTTIRLSLTELARHGGDTGPHGDGWGVGFYQGGDALLMREPEAAHDSRWVQFLQERPVPTQAAIAHIRRATQGEKLLRNTQPFARELGGRLHLFAHNGMSPGIEADPRFPTQRFRRVGETDSEHAFCALLDRLAPLWDLGEPSHAEQLRVVRAFAAELRTLGPANFLYSDGDVIIAHGHQRRSDTGELGAPGLHLLCRSCSAGAEPHAAEALAGVSIDPQAQQEVALLASVPLSAEPWQALAEGELVVLRGGRVVQRLAP